MSEKIKAVKLKKISAKTHFFQSRGRGHLNSNHSTWSGIRPANLSQGPGRLTKSDFKLRSNAREFPGGRC